MSDSANSTDISFDEFKELCEEAGISTDNLEQMEQDFRVGMALADVTDALITDQETHPVSYSATESLNLIDVGVTYLADPHTTEEKRKAATNVAVQALRYLAEHCHDEGQNWVARWDALEKLRIESQKADDEMIERLHRRVVEQALKSVNPAFYLLKYKPEKKNPTEEVNPEWGPVIP